MEERFSRLTYLLGEEAVKKLKNRSVFIAGLGGVGSFCAEALVRSGVGTIGIMDSDTVEPSNLNRQLVALESTLGNPKTDVFEKRAREINPEVKVIKYEMFLNRDTREYLDLKQYDVVADCIDSLIPKLNMIISCLDNGIPVVASTGSGFKLDPTQIKAGSIWDTRNDRLAHRMRKKLRQWGYGEKDFPVVYSTEQRSKEEAPLDTIGSIVTVTGSFGLTIAAEVINIILKKQY